MSDDVEVRAELFAGAIAAVAAACGIETWRRPIASIADVKVALDSTLERLEDVFAVELDATGRDTARAILHELTAPVAAVAAQLVQTFVECTGAEVDERHVLELVAEHLIVDVASA